MRFCLLLLLACSTAIDAQNQALKSIRALLEPMRKVEDERMRCRSASLWQVSTLGGILGGRLKPANDDQFKTGQRSLIREHQLVIPRQR
jgi:hypothetical protein